MFCCMQICLFLCIFVGFFTKKIKILILYIFTNITENQYLEVVIPNLLYPNFALFNKDKLLALTPCYEIILTRRYQ